MAEMCVNLEDKRQADPRLDAQGWKRGFVVSIQEDGYKWGAAETTGQFAIVKVPGTPASKLSALLVAEPGDEINNKMLQRRAFRFDIDSHDGHALTLDSALALKVAVPAKDDPDVLGESQDVL